MPNVKKLKYEEKTEFRGKFLSLPSNLLIDLLPEIGQVRVLKTGFPKIYTA